MAILTVASSSAIKQQKFCRKFLDLLREIVDYVSNITLPYDRTLADLADDLSLSTIEDIVKKDSNSDLYASLAGSVCTRLPSKFLSFDV